MTPIIDSNEFADALTQPKAILFLYVDWAVQARSARTHIDKVIASWKGDDSGEAVPVYVVDVSAQCGELWDAVAHWLTEQGCPVGQLMMSGVGPAVLVRFGHVIMHVNAPLQYEATTLKAAFQSAFKDT